MSIICPLEIMPIGHNVHNMSIGHYVQGRWTLCPSDIMSNWTLCPIGHYVHWTLCPHAQKKFLNKGHIWTLCPLKICPKYVPNMSRICPIISTSAFNLQTNIS